MSNRDRIGNIIFYAWNGQRVTIVNGASESYSKKFIAQANELHEMPKGCFIDFVADRWAHAYEVGVPGYKANDLATIVKTGMLP